MLTIGMAHYRDFSGVYFTVQSIRMFHPELKDVEYVVIDQSPGSESSRMLDGLASAVPNFHLVRFPEPLGTSPSRNKVFETATRDLVLCMDCHVMLKPGSITQWLKEDHGNDLWQGPMIYDTLRSFSTHFDPIWRAEMWGIWGQAWQCKCGKLNFAAHAEHSSDGATFGAHSLNMEAVPLKSCFNCKTPIPNVPWTGHEVVIEEMGYRRIGIDDNDEKFEIPGQGLGMFGCRREAWPGFNQDARGFGGEELYIHEKFRQRGDKVWCAPYLKWLHRFGREYGVQYPLSRWNKVRNYVLEFNELGMDLNPIKHHFLEVGFPEKHWDHLIDDPIAHAANPEDQRTATGPVEPSDRTDYKSLDEVFKTIAGHTRDLNEHMEMIRVYAAKCKHVTDVSGRYESAVAILAAEPDVVKIWNPEKTNALGTAIDMSSSKVAYVGTFEVVDIEKTEMLFLDTEHTYDRLTHELDNLGMMSTRFIIVHDTTSYGNTGSDGGRGKLHALRDFMKRNKKWSVIYHTTMQYGLTVIGCQLDDKPKPPSKIKMAKNFLSALANHIATGGDVVSHDELESRLNACTMCAQHVDGRCAACGCPVEKKASWKSEECPLGIWNI